MQTGRNRRKTAAQQTPRRCLLHAKDCPNCLPCINSSSLHNSPMGQGHYYHLHFTGEVRGTERLRNTAKALTPQSLEPQSHSGICTLIGSPTSGEDLVTWEGRTAKE